MAKRRVVITGMGMLTSLGLTVASTWEAILRGQSGVSTIDTFDVSNFSTQFCAYIKNFDPEVYMPAKDARKMDGFVQYGLAATIQAVEDSGIVVTEENAYRIGTAIGSGIGGLPMIEKTNQVLVAGGPRKVSPFFVPSAIINMISGYASMQYGLKGPNIAVVTACTTGTHNIGLAARMIGYGDADIMVAGGSEMSVSALGVAGFASMRALSTRNADPAAASRPWDKDRDGFVLGDGAGVLVLEEYEHAKQRGAKIYAEVLGFGMSADAYHITSPDPQGTGAMMAMQNAIRDAGYNVDQVDYVNAHATSTVAGDELEAIALKRTFGEHAKAVKISSTKSMTGHLLGAAGAIEAIFSILAIRDNVVPPTINLDNPSPGCDLDFVPHTAQTIPVNCALSNSFGFGGTNGSLLFGRI